MGNKSHVVQSEMLACVHMARLHEQLLEPCNYYYKPFDSLQFVFMNSVIVLRL